MEAQYAETKGELILDLKEKSTPLTIKEFSTAGVRGQFNSQGEVKGKYNALPHEASLPSLLDLSFSLPNLASRTVEDCLAWSHATFQGYREAFADEERENVESSRGTSRRNHGLGR